MPGESPLLLFYPSHTAQQREMQLILERESSARVFVAPLLAVEAFLNPSNQGTFFGKIWR